MPRDSWITVNGYGRLEVNFGKNQKLPEGVHVYHCDEGRYGIVVKGCALAGSYYDRFKARKAAINIWKGLNNENLHPDEVSG